MPQNHLTLTSSVALQLAVFGGELPAIPSGLVASTIKLTYASPEDNLLFPVHASGTLNRVDVFGTETHWLLHLDTTAGDKYVLDLVPAHMDLISVQVNLTAAP